MAPFSHPAHRTGQADFPHPDLGQNFTPSPTARRAQAGSGVRSWRRISSRIFLVALQQFDRDALRSADEANADARPDGGRLLGELDTLGLDLGGHGIDVLHRQSEMVEP